LGNITTTPGKSWRINSMLVSSNSSDQTSPSRPYSTRIPDPLAHHFYSDVVRI
jgi:hypothetical protein